MDILINSTQSKKIIIESNLKDVGSKIKHGYSFVKDVLTKSGEQIGENLTFLFTWGASIAGIMGPLNDYIKNNSPQLSDIEISLILTGVISNYYIDNKKLFKKIYDKIEELGLIGVFREVLTKSEELKKAFVDFISSLSVTGHKMTNIMSYAFIIPIIPMIYDSISSGIITQDDAYEISERIISFGLVTISGILLKQLILKLIKRFQSKQI